MDMQGTNNAYYPASAQCRLLWQNANYHSLCTYYWLAIVFRLEAHLLTYSRTLP